MRISSNAKSLLQPLAFLPVVLLIATSLPAFAGGPPIDWDPAYGWQVGATPTNMPPGGEFKMVGIVSAFDVPFGDLNALDPTREYTFYLSGLISNGTVAIGPPATTFYETHFTGGTFELYEDLSPESAFAPFPPDVSTFIDGTPLLTGAFTSFVVQSNNFTAFQTGNIEGALNWTGGSLLPRAQAGGCTGLLTGGMTWRSTVVIPGYLFRHDGKMDLQCPTSAHESSWGRIKSLYR
jgi:hypothetical protein